MTATDELRRMLDERGVEYECDAHESIWHNVYYERTSWNTPEGQYVEYTEPIGAKPATLGSHTDMGWDNPTPQQAIDATLGRGTCHIDVIDSGEIAYYCCNERIMHCNGCGHEFGHVLYDEDGNVWMSERPNYCPNCGREVVDA